MKIRTLAAVVTGCALSASALAGSNNSLPAAPRFEAQATGNPVTEILNFNTPHDVYQIRAQSNGKTLRIDTTDCCIVGDKWSIRVVDLSNGQVIDVRGKGSGSAAVASGAVTIYRDGPQDIDALVEVRYSEGVATFPAGMYVNFTAGGGGTPTVTTTLQTTLVPLPSS